jgi:Ca-activated chloride channel family protein
MSRKFQMVKSIVLVAIALAYGTVASAKATLVGIDDVKGGSLLFATKSPGRHIQAPLLATDVNISVSGPIARVRLRQTFLNPSKHWLEGRYVFPLPQQSAVHRMTMRGRDMEIVAEIKEKDVARTLYRQAQQSGRRAALIEQHRPNIFTTSVANLAPAGTIDVEISYLQRVRYDQGHFRLRFPLVVAPRYTPHTPLQMVDAPAGTVPSPSGTDPILPKSPVIHPDAGQLNPVKLVVHLDAGVPLAGLTSPHHQIVASDWHGGKSEITLAKGVVPADRDFELVWTPEPTAQPTVALFHEKMDDENFILAMVLPPAPDKAPPPLPRDVIFVLDKSGSMSGSSIRQAKKALVFALERLTPRDRFNIMRFANQTDSLFDGVRNATTAARQLAAQFVAATRAQGGTNMRPALLAALAGMPTDGRLRQIVFLTDAAISNEAALFDEIASRIGQNRLFTVGIGSAPNSYFMQRAAELGRGSFTYIGNTQEVGETMRALFRKIERPMATGLAARWDGFPGDGHRIDSYPGLLPDLYDGEPVILAARIKGGAFSLQNTALSLTGNTGGIPWRQDIALSAAHAVVGAGTLWGRARITDLMMSLHRGAESNSVRRAVTATALRHHMVSRYTSLVAAEKKVTRPADEPIFPRALPRNLPDGWDFEKVFGGILKTKATSIPPDTALPVDQSAPKPRRKASLQRLAHPAKNIVVAGNGPAPMVAQGQAVRLPAGSTAAALNLIVGVLALLIGVILMRRRRAS